MRETKLRSMPRTLSLVLMALFTANCGKFAAQKSELPTPLPIQTEAPDKRHEESLEPIESASPDAVQLRARWDERTPKAALYTKYVLEGLSRYGRNIIKKVPRDMAVYCPKYSELDQHERTAVWVMFISAMAERENRGFNPKLAYPEKKMSKNKKGEIIVSRGLLQISSESGRSYGCDIKTEMDLENPRKNLHCGIRIISRQLMKSNVISASKEVSVRVAPEDPKMKPYDKLERKWFGASAYWSVLRSRESHSHIRDQVSGMNLCKGMR